MIGLNLFLPEEYWSPGQRKVFEDGISDRTLTRIFSAGINQEDVGKVIRTTDRHKLLSDIRFFKCGYCGIEYHGEKALANRTQHLASNAECKAKFAKEKHFAKSALGLAARPYLVTDPKGDDWRCPVPGCIELALKYAKYVPKMREYVHFYL